MVYGFRFRPSLDAVAEPYKKQPRSTPLGNAQSVVRM
jgi:hypothetical protein